MVSQAARKRQTCCLSISPRELRMGDSPESSSETGRDLLLKSKHRLSHWLPVKHKLWMDSTSQTWLVQLRQGSMHWLPLQNKSSTSLHLWVIWLWMLPVSRSIILKQFAKLWSVETLGLWPRLCWLEILSALTATVNAKHGLLWSANSQDWRGWTF